MICRIFVEEQLKNHDHANKILAHFPNAPVKYIRKVEDVFGRVHRPYLQKREDLQLFIGEKKGQLIKEAPPAYGTKGAPHYYFVHAYNCIYECNYCYLQGYFNSPDLVFFINHQDVIKAMEQKLSESSNEHKVWFHAGEFSDSLALSHITGELPLYFDFFNKHPNAMLELRTKSANAKELLKLDPLDNIIVSFSVSPAKKIKINDLKTPSLSARLKAISKVAERGYKIGIHLDPIIFEDNFESIYKELISQLLEHASLDCIEYVSLGVVRFTKDVFYQVKKNYPSSELLRKELIKSDDGKIRYPRPMRNHILGSIKNLLLENGFSEQQVYLCMED
jgi:spore photoproduct lyase